MRKGKTLHDVSEAFSVPETRIAADNGLNGEIREGQILRLPQERRNLYVVRAGDSKQLLCGGREQYKCINGTDAFYPGMKIWL